MVRKRRVLKAMIVAVSATMLMVSSVGASGHHSYKKFKNSIDFKNYKNVIVLIPDGCDETVQTVARWYKGEDLQVDKMAGGGVKVHMANSVIPGSAAAATAFATGHKTTVRFLGVGPRTDDLLTGFEPTAEPYAPVASILEAAKLAGKATGISGHQPRHPRHAGGLCLPYRRPRLGQRHHGAHGLQQCGRGLRRRRPSPDPERRELYTTSFGDTWGGKRTDGENLMEFC
jgi:alkaline phosphatase